MKSVSNGKPSRYCYRSTPALSTQEAAALVMGMIEARLRDGWQIDQIGWPKFCRDTAVIQVVTQQLNHHMNSYHRTRKEVSS